MKRIFGSIIIICVLCVVVFPQQKRTVRDPCKDPMSQVEFNFCARRKYEQADAGMNKVYKQLMLGLAGYKSDNQQKLQEAQTLWLKYRDANCASEASVYEGGTIRPTVYYSCLASVTQERTKRLKAFLVEIR
ncbi:MAG: lysozyme inhibitor LprI family protein [Pyrinomonadaceae bacterium]